MANRFFGLSIWLLTIRVFHLNTRKKRLQLIFHLERQNQHHPQYLSRRESVSQFICAKNNLLNGYSCSEEATQNAAASRTHPCINSSVNLGRRPENASESANAWVSRTVRRRKKMLDCHSLIFLIASKAFCSQNGDRIRAPNATRICAPFDVECSLRLHRHWQGIWPASKIVKLVFSRTRQSASLRHRPFSSS